MSAEATSDLFHRIRISDESAANPASVVVLGHARFSVLTSRLIRMEWSAKGVFEDRGTFAFPSRAAPAPPYTSQVVRGKLTIDTGELMLSYRESDGPFSAENLSITITLNGQPQTWTPGLSDPQNLRGTCRTLDRCGGAVALEEGLLSRSGWALVDDSRSVLFNRAGDWIEPRPAAKAQDWYFFGYGHDYQAALGDYIRFAGKMPLLPRYALGVWWSRYWAYSDQELKNLVLAFESHDLPLDVLVLDMDWHTPDSWTGYTWNRKLFPDPTAFLAWVHEHGLHVTLNLHPAEGVQPFEEVYPRFAAAMGLDPAAVAPIPFQITDRTFVKHYFELLHHPMEDDGVDFWWMDWQQGRSCEMQNLDPLPWINHLHFQDATRREGRPLLYSRWGGLGNHRYAIGFSGDTIVGWSALQFQPHFTATAANVGYGWWSHDIGGHLGGAIEPELYARWAQFGAMSPCFRIHTTKHPQAERRPWMFPLQTYLAIKAACIWRYQLMPYLYTMARLASDTGVGLCRPMYFEYPEEESAYLARDQYFFGDQIIAAPIVSPAEPTTGMATTDVWVPPGMWIEYTTREVFTGPRWVRLSGDLHALPMLVRAGAVIPLAPRANRVDAIPHDLLILSVFPGANGTFRLYEDDGMTPAYTQGQYEWTTITTYMEAENTCVISIAPVEGYCDRLPKRRRFEIHLQGTRRPVAVMINGLKQGGWLYNPDTLVTTVSMPLYDKRMPITVTVVTDGALSVLGQMHSREVIVADVERLIRMRCPDVDWDILQDAVLRVSVPGRAAAVARLGGPFIHMIEYTTPEEAAQQLGCAIIAAPADNSHFAVDVRWTLFQGSEARTQTTSMAYTTTTQIITCPFACESALPARWEATIDVIWRDEHVSQIHRSAPLFPTISTWRVAIYNREQQPLTLSKVVDVKGRAQEGLSWQTHIQAEDELRAVTEPYVVSLASACGERLRVGEPLSAFALTTIVSPCERTALLLVSASGEIALALNGQELEPVAEEQVPPMPVALPDLFACRKAVLLHLRAGENTLVIDLRRPEGEFSWRFVGALLNEDRTPVTDLAFVVNPPSPSRRARRAPGPRER